MADAVVRLPPRCTCDIIRVRHLFGHKTKLRNDWRKWVDLILKLAGNKFILQRNNGNLKPDWNDTGFGSPILVWKCLAFYFLPKTKSSNGQKFQKFQISNGQNVMVVSPFFFKRYILVCSRNTFQGENFLIQWTILLLSLLPIVLEHFNPLPHPTPLLPLPTPLLPLPTPLLPLPILLLPRPTLLPPLLPLPTALFHPLLTVPVSLPLSVNPTLFLPVSILHHPLPATLLLHPLELLSPTLWLILASILFLHRNWEKLKTENLPMDWSNGDKNVDASGVKVRIHNRKFFSHSNMILLLILNLGISRDSRITSNFFHNRKILHSLIWRIKGGRGCVLRVVQGAI